LFKTLFSKQITLLITVVLIAFTIETSMFYVFVNDVISKDKENDIENAADNLDIFMRLYMDNQFSRSVSNQLRMAIERTGELHETIIMLIGQDGRLLALASSYSLRATAASVVDNFTDAGAYYVIGDERVYSRLFQLEDGQASKDIGDFYGLFRDTGYPWLNMQKKYTIELADGEDFRYLISIHAPMPLVQEARRAIVNIVVQSALISATIAIIIGFIFSSRLTKPIRKINDAAKVISNGNFSERISIVSHDEIGQLAGTFNQMVQELENLETTRSEFIANVSHELRTPMTSIKGFVEGILDGTIPPDRQERYLNIVKDETERLNRLVNNLLDMARFESGGYRLNVTWFNVVEAVRQCVISFVRLIEEKGVTISASFARDYIYAEADRDSIERVIYNLLHNAIKFSRQGGEIRLVVKEDREHAIVVVSDDGIGISEDELASIWERFYKSDKSRGQDKTGTGLGLSIIRNIINEHKQKIHVYSKLGEGTTFEFTLKRVDAALAMDAGHSEDAECKALPPVED
jgi:signal transduction histidine kinase